MPRIEVRIPDLGETLVEALVSRWRKREGDAVAVGDVLAELETDKADVELAAEYAGRLVEVRVPEGRTAAKGEVVAVIDTDAGAFSPSRAPDATPAPPVPQGLEPDCLRCGTRLQPATSTGGRVGFAGEPVRLLVCRQCGHVEMIAEDPARF
jgi:pyruvate/2-oxoglutarate dehydrogenase complex dihydrolipoamide acyltransferase (E2) component